nr:DNA-processing protein DprA [Ardenticatena sp.]
MPEPTTTQAYWIAFNHVSGIGPAKVRRLLTHFGSLEHAWEANPGELAAAGLDRRAIEQLLATRRTFSFEKTLTRLDRLGITVLTWDDDAYPARLRTIPSSPPVLYLRGTLTPEDDWALAVVGTRRITRYGQEVTRRLVEPLAAEGVTIVSGLAIGVDAHAHRTALDAGGRTIAVLGSGVDQIYPASNRALARRILDHGALVSDYPPGTPPEPNNFPPRNRIISGLALGVLVVEAGKKSGALITANYALEQGRDVMAVPGSILSAQSRGTNRLIAEGATPICSADDILQALNLEWLDTQRAVQRIVPENPIEQAILDALREGPMHVDDLGRALDLDAATLTSTLVFLELKGHVRAVGGMTYVRVR